MSDSKSGYHPLVEMTRIAVSSADGSRALELRDYDGKLERMLDFYDRLIRAVESVGLTVEARQVRDSPWRTYICDGKDKIWVSVGGRESGIGFHIEEFSRRGHRRNWYDHKIKRIEDYIPEIVRNIRTRIDEKRPWRIQREKESLERMQTEHLHRRKKELHCHVVARKRANEIRELVEAFEAAGHSSQEFVEWARFARDYADSIDPVTTTAKPYIAPGFAIREIEPEHLRSLYSYQPYEPRFDSRENVLWPPWAPMPLECDSETY